MSGVDEHKPAADIEYAKREADEYVLDLGDKQYDATSATKSVESDLSEPEYSRTSESSEIPFTLPENYAELSAGQKAAASLSLAYSYITQRDPLVYVMGVSFIGLFIGYSSVQSLLTIRDGALGSYILAILYAVYACTALVSPLLIRFIGPAVGLVTASSCYALFIASFYLNVNGIVYGAAALAGLGAGLLWPCNGLILVALSTPATRASNSGIFQSMYRSAGLITGLVIGSIQKSIPNINNQFTLYLGFALFGVVGFLVFTVGYIYRLRTYGKQIKQITARVTHQPIQAVQAGAVDVTAMVPSNNIGERVVQVFKLLVSTQFIWFIPYLIFLQGATQAWWVASMNTIVAKVGVQWYGWMAAIDGSFAMAASFGTGIWFEYMRRHSNTKFFKVPVYTGMVLQYIGFAMAIGLNQIARTHTPAQLLANDQFGYYLTAAVFTSLFYTIGFAIAEVSIFVYLQTFFPAIGEIAFSAKIFCECVGWTASFLIAANMTANSIYLPVIWLGVNLISIAAFRQWRVPQIAELTEIRANTATAVINQVGQKKNTLEHVQVEV